MYRKKRLSLDNSRHRPPRPADNRLARVAKGTGIGLIAAMVALIVLIVLLRWVPVPTSAFMLSQKLKGKSIEYQWVQWAEISSYMPIAVVAAEDQRFPDHWGFDFKAINDAMRENLRRTRPRGASTISQQVAKNLFLWSGRSWIRKGLEAGFTVAIEVLWPKRRILEVYLNIAQFGPGTFGVAAAGRRYFDIPPSGFGTFQAALLAAVLPNPNHYSLSPPGPYVLKQAAHIEKQIGLLGGPAYLAGLK